MPLDNPASALLPEATSQASYALRKLDLTFTLGGGGTFGSSGANELTITGQRTYAHLEYVISPYGALTAILRIYGMSLDHMNAISVAGLLFQGRVGTNKIRVRAGDDASGMATVADDRIMEAYPKFDGGADDRHFYVSAIGAPTDAQLKSAASSSYSSSVPASQVLDRLAKQIGYTLRNDGVKAVLQTPYFWGTVWQQIQAAARAAHCFYFLDSVNKILRIWPKSGPESDAAAVIISKDNGMIGYPMFQANQIIVRTRFNPALSIGQIVTVQSELGAANNARLWLSSVTHDLSSQWPGGPWETTMIGIPTRPA